MKNLYAPIRARVTRIEELSENVRLFRFKKDRGRFAKNHGGLTFIPGQFVMAGLWGYGESPIGILSSPYEDSFMEILVRKVGVVTNALHRLNAGDEMTIRGPYGNGFPVSFFEGKDVVMVSGGCGIPPIAALIEYIIQNRERFGRVYLLYGAATPQDILAQGRLDIWGRHVNILLTVDRPAPGWKGHVGLVSEMVKDIEINPLNAVATMCGPGPMMMALERILRPLGISDRRIYVSLERRMQCGIGKCQHCTTGDSYVCLDGPVYNFDEIDKNWD
ncbi:MAG: FAD/NAD(P)-binding protein [Deltaproteobacteria bacterium]|nr:FAD/NAD(P)-binding protein [Deltaproteobacteria bacterium]